MKVIWMIPALITLNLAFFCVAEPKQAFYRRFELKNGKIQLQASRGVNNGYDRGNDLDLEQNINQKSNFSTLHSPFSQFYFDNWNISSDMFIPSSWTFHKNNQRSPGILNPESHVKHTTGVNQRKSEFELSHSGKRDSENQPISENMSLNNRHHENLSHFSIDSETSKKPQTENAPLALITFRKSRKVNLSERESTSHDRKIDNSGIILSTVRPHRPTIVDTSRKGSPKLQDSASTPELPQKLFQFAPNYNWKPISRSGIPLNVENLRDINNSSESKNRFMNDNFVSVPFQIQNNFSDTDKKEEHPNSSNLQKEYSNQNKYLQINTKPINEEITYPSVYSFLFSKERQPENYSRQYSHSVNRHAFSGTAMNNLTLQENPSSNNKTLSRVYIPVTAIFLPTVKLLGNNGDSLDYDKINSGGNENASNSLSHIYVPYGGAPTHDQNTKTDTNKEKSNVPEILTNSDSSFNLRTHIYNRERAEVHPTYYNSPDTRNQEISIFKNSSENLFHRKPIMNSNSYEASNGHFGFEKQSGDSNVNRFQHPSSLHLKNNSGYVFFPDEFTHSRHFVKNNILKNFERQLIDQVRNIDKNTLIPPKQHFYQLNKQHLDSVHLSTAPQQLPTNVNKPKIEPNLQSNVYSDGTEKKESPVRDKSHDAYHISWRQNVPFTDIDLNQNRDINYNVGNFVIPETSYFSQVQPKDDSEGQTTEWSQYSTHQQTPEKEYSKGNAPFANLPEKEPSEVYNSFDETYAKLPEQVRNPKFSFLKQIKNFDLQHGTRSFPTSDDNEDYNHETEVEDGANIAYEHQLDNLKFDVGVKNFTDQSLAPSHAMVLVLLVQKTTYPSSGEETKIIKQ